MYQPLNPETCEHRLIRWYFEELPTTDPYRCDYGSCRHCLSRIPSPPVVLPQRTKTGWLAKPLIRKRAKDIARYKLHAALRKGTVKKKPCEVCGDHRSEAHHPDYSRPLDVIWLCHDHHVQADKERRRHETI